MPTASVGTTIRVAYVTGWRTHSELQTRTWEHVDFDNGASAAADA